MAQLKKECQNCEYWKRLNPALSTTHGICQKHPHKETTRQTDMCFEYKEKPK